MRRFDSYFVLMGILRCCPDNQIPADTQAIQRSLFKLSKWYPNLLSESLFDENGFSQKLEDDLEMMMLNHSLGLCGERLEVLEISDSFKHYYDWNVSGAFSKRQATYIMKMGCELPKLLRNNESTRYKRLIRV